MNLVKNLRKSLKTLTMFRSKKKKIYPEQKEQIAFFQYLELAHKKYVDVCFSIPNEGKRTDIQLFIMSKAGLTAGVPDVFCAIPNKYSHGLFIEFKYGDNKLTPAQKRMIPLLQAMDYQCNVCYSADQAIEVFKEYISNI